MKNIRMILFKLTRVKARKGVARGHFTSKQRAHRSGDILVAREVSERGIEILQTRATCTRVFLQRHTRW